YRNLIERAIKARLVYGSPHMNRAVSFEYMNRQLVWNEFSEMLLLLFSLLNSASMKSLLRPFSKDNSSGSTGDETLCPICQANPTTVYLALPCQHRYTTAVLALSTVITVLEPDVQQHHHSGAPVVVNQLLQCNGMVVPETQKRMTSVKGEWNEIVSQYGLYI
ncbi:peroxisome biogenesis protein 2, partial [Tanacetum coccineum]